MPEVESFESSISTPEEAAKAQEKFSYRQLVELFNKGWNLEVAQNVFARCAKRQLRDLLGAQAKMGASTTGPTYVSRAEVAIPPEQLVAGYVLLESELTRLVESLAAQMLTTAMSCTIRLEEALVTQVLEIGPEHLKFSLKQVWSRDA